MVGLVRERAEAHRTAFAIEDPDSHTLRSEVDPDQVRAVSHVGSPPELLPVLLGHQAVDAVEHVVRPVGSSPTGKIVAPGALAASHSLVVATVLITSDGCAGTPRSESFPAYSSEARVGLFETNTTLRRIPGKACKSRFGPGNSSEPR